MHKCFHCTNPKSKKKKEKFLEKYITPIAFLIA